MRLARMSGRGRQALWNPRRGDRRGGQAVRRVAAGGALLAVALLSGTCGPADDQDLPPRGEGLPVQVVEEMVLRETEGGRLRWVLHADSAINYGDEERTLLMGVHVDFYDAEGESIRSVLTAQTGEVDPDTRDLVARGNVVVTGREGHRLETEELRWDPEREKVVSDRFVRLTKGESVVTGMGIESDPGLRRYLIQSEVRGELREEDELIDEL